MRKDQAKTRATECYKEHKEVLLGVTMSTMIDAGPEVNSYTVPLYDLVCLINVLDEIQTNVRFAPTHLQP